MNQVSHLWPSMQWLTNFYTHFHSAQTFKATPAQAPKLLKLLRPKPVFQPKKTGPFQVFKTHHFFCLRASKLSSSFFSPASFLRLLSPTFVTSLSLFIIIIFFMYECPSVWLLVYPLSLYLFSPIFRASKLSSSSIRDFVPLLCVALRLFVTSLSLFIFFSFILSYSIYFPYFYFYYVCMNLFSLFLFSLCLYDFLIDFWLSLLFD